jgi:1-deoxy-D-xylulose-5-phosphate reductoisomerase
MMNKGLEFIEAMHLFQVDPEQIQVVVHPQSVIHSMVELVDGTVIAQLGITDMGLPIQLAMTYPQRCASPFEGLDFWKMSDLTFEEPDLENVPCLRLAMECARERGIAPCVMSAANEIAVHKFLGGELGYNRIYDAVQAAVDHFDPVADPDLDTILEYDTLAREYVRENF